MALSLPVKIVALSALALALGLGGVMLLLKPHASAASAPLVVVPPPAARHAVVVKTSAPKPAPKPTAPKVHIEPGVPPLIAAVLQQKPVVVVAVYSSRNPGDVAVAKQAAEGAHDAHAPWIAINVANNTMATAVATWSSSVADPAVLVVKRPGTISFSIVGPTDRATIAQAVANAR